ncbi:MAG: restriction endonuclease subunit S [Nitrospirota bacterium]
MYEINNSTLRIPHSELPRGWRWVRLGEVCEKPQYGYTASADDKKVGPKLLRITDIQNGEVNWDGVPYCRCDTEIDKYLLKSGDILIARTGGTTGKSYLITKVPSTTIFASYLIRVRTGSNLIPEYLYQFLQSDIYWQQVALNMRGGAQPNMNATLIGGLCLPLPPLPEQKRISTKIHELMQEVYNLKSAILNQKSAVDALPQAFLRKAFRGEL